MDILTPTGNATPLAGGSGTSTPRSSKKSSFTPLVTVIGFHHARGPEVESWYGVPEGADPSVDYGWSLLPFMALSDGAHASTEDFSYFTLLRPATETEPATSLFGISCTRQMDSNELLNRPADVTRSTVQKAVVVIADNPQTFGALRERLSVVTYAWFAQREFTDTEILRRFQDSLADEKERGLLSEDDGRDTYLGMSLREMIHEFKWQALVLLKCCLLQPKMLFFGSRCERLCMMQFSLISLIPGLIRKLQDCADPELNSFEEQLTMPTHLRTSNRASLQAYMGLPLQIFGKGSLFGPYTPLQQLDVLADHETKSYIVGSTNSLLLQQRDRYSDILINLDEDFINITSPSLKQALQLSTPDRRWIDFVTQTVNETWDDANPSRPKTMAFMGSEEFIRLQFEDYVVALLASVKYHNFMIKHKDNPKMFLSHIEGDPATDFNMEWVEAWMKTENYRIWNNNTDSHLFDIVEPRHICAGGLTIDDVSRRVSQQVQELHLDEKLAVGKEVAARNWAAAREKGGTMINKFYAELESKSKRDGSSASSVHSSSEWDVKSPRMSTSSSFFGRDKKSSMESESILGSEESSTASSPEASPRKPRIDFATQENGVWNDDDSVTGHRMMG
ncbi:Late secretory pathway protein AVL9 [Cytospora mali]|uniref:Late secretory pathway protein AVL9 n=1 Tax=Cytospora mali TaxID=578113 RepID=A0A194VXJ4_CYTMA|nr:Late secretory pathway protein AVL9 [Valsa mali]